jgi:hypothetical protein
MVTMSTVAVVARPKAVAPTRSRLRPRGETVSAWFELGGGEAATGAVSHTSWVVVESSQMPSGPRSGRSSGLAGMLAE